MPECLMQDRVPSSLASVEQLCLKVRRLLQEWLPNRPSDRFALELLARETLSNAAKYGSGLATEKSIFCKLLLYRNWILLRVGDEGPGFPWQEVMARPVDDDASHGRGLHLLALYAQRVIYNRRGNGVILARLLEKGTMGTDAPSAATPTVFHPGDLTSSTVDGIRQRLKTLLEAGSVHLILDLSGVQMVDSTGIGLLIQIYNTLTKQEGSLTIRGASEDIKNLFRSMRLEQRFNLQDA